MDPLLHRFLQGFCGQTFQCESFNRLEVTFRVHREYEVVVVSALHRNEVLGLICEFEKLLSVGVRDH